jgi:hypothetical protein
MGRSDARDDDGGTDEAAVVPPSSLRVADSPIHGLGVFATRDFEPGELLERSPVLVIADEHEELVAGTALDGYCFTWDGGLAVGLGWTSLYNHSNHPNARYWTMPEEGVIEVVAHTRIRRGDEVLVTYNGDPDAEGDLWFDDRTDGA